MREGFAAPQAPLFDASPNCPASTFEARPFDVVGTGTDKVDTNTPARTVQDYIDLLFNTENTGETGLITNTFTSSVSSYYNKSTQKWTNAEGYLTAIKANATNTHTAFYLTQQNSASATPVDAANVSEQTRFDNELLARTKAEYCMYRKYYNGFLSKFISGLNEGDTNTTDETLQNWLKILIELNTKLNALVGLVDHIANRRSGYVFARGSAIDQLNQEIQNQVAASPVPHEIMKSKENILNTRKEMIRYTKEKNNSISNHISLWAALNVVAIAMIFTLYRKI